TRGRALAPINTYNTPLLVQTTLDVHTRGDDAGIILELGLRATPRKQGEFSLAVFVQFCRQATKTDLVPRSVEFSHAAPRDVAEHQRIFRAPLAFGQPETALVVPRAALDLPLAHADAGLLSLLERQIHELVLRLPQGESVTDRARRLIAEELSGGDPSVDTVARQLRMSPRTLPRPLKDGGTSFRLLLDSLRHDMAARYLAEDDLPIAEAAFLLGFSEASAFHRSFKRWTGQTPAEFRKAAGQ